ncbi:MAG: carbohydrate ABC transporter permease [Clostridia bacterium]|nr:carbohydrate ABC transporter permease [Clostridia bacterium]
MIKIKRREKRRFKDGHVTRSGLNKSVTYFFVAILCAFMLLPGVYVIGNSLKPVDELFKFPPTIVPQNPTIQNFRLMLNLLSETNMSFFRYFFNTVFITAVVAAAQIIMASMTAYSLSKIPYPGSNAIFQVIVYSMMINSSVASVPTFIIFSKLGIIDTYWGMIVPGLVSTMGFYLMKQFMETNVPNELLEAGRIDGAAELSIFFKIVMPLLKPAWYTLIILSIQNLWGRTSSNAYREVFKTLPEALSQISTGGLERTGVAGACAVVMMAVPLICFIVMQSNMLDTMSSSGLKG